MAKDDPARAARLAQALRNNLKRRKEQARDQGAAELPSEPPPTTLPSEP